MQSNSHKALARLAQLCLATSTLTAAVPASAAVTDYPNGSNNSAPIVLTDNSTRLQVLTGSAIQSGVISEAGVGFGLEKIGTGTLTLTAANSYTGGTVITAGTLQLGSGGSLSNTGALTLNGGTFDLGGHFQTIGALSGNGTIAGNQGFLATNSNANTTLAASILGADGLIKGGTGTLMLTGNSNFFGDPGITISAGVLQIGDGGTSGSVSGNIANNATLIFNRSDTATYAGRISGSGSVQKIGTGTLILTGFSNNFTGTTTIAAGKLQIGDNTNGPYLSGNFVNNSFLIFDIDAASSIPGVISGSGTVMQIGSGTTTLTAANTYSGGTVVNAGTLQLGVGGSLLSTGALTVNGGAFSLNGQNQTVGAVSGNSGFIALTNATLTTNSNTDSIFAGQFTAINNSGASLIKAGPGRLILTNNSIIPGGVTIAAGTLQLGNGGTTGALPLSGTIVNNGILAINRSDVFALTNVITGAGSLEYGGTGTLTLSVSNTYTGATRVNAGTLNVTGRIAGSGVSVASGGKLSGTGSVSTTNIASGGTLMPGSSGTPGTLTVTGNLTLASDTNFVDFVTPSAAGLVSVSGMAAINGGAMANFAAGAYVPGQRYALVTATGGLTGTFSTLITPGLPASVKGRLSYDTNNVYLNLDPNALTPSLSNATGNQSHVVKAIDAAVQGGAVPPAGFQALYNLSGSALNGAIDQISGQIGPNIVDGAGQVSLSFLSLTSQGGDGGASFAPGSAYGAAGAPHRAQLDTGEMRVWGAAFGGHIGLSADAVSGAASLSGTNAGLIGGLDKRITDNLLVGATVGWGSQNFHSGNGTGDSDDVTVGIYARHESGPLYISAALDYGWHRITTLRTVTVSGTDVLQSKQDASDVGGRIEAGYRLSLDQAYDITPYAAFMADSLESPAYAETAVSGASTFALSYAGHTSTLGRTEAGAKLSRDYALEDGTLAAGIRAAWAHQIDDAPLSQATFLGLPGAGFVVAGARHGASGRFAGNAPELRPFLWRDRRDATGRRHDHCRRHGHFGLALVARCAPVTRGLGSRPRRKDGQGTFHEMHAFRGFCRVDGRRAGTGCRA